MKTINILKENLVGKTFYDKQFYKEASKIIEDSGFEIHFFHIIDTDIERGEWEIKNLILIEDGNKVDYFLVLDIDRDYNMTVNDIYDITWWKDIYNESWWKEKGKNDK